MQHRQSEAKPPGRGAATGEDRPSPSPSVIFERALATDPSARPAFLRRACGDDAGLRRELESLLAALPEAEDAFRSMPHLEIVLANLDAREEEGGSEGLRPIPDRLGDYRVVGQLGRGGMGTVYLGFDPSLDRRVALKVLDGSLATGPEARERLQREARLLAQVAHPNIATIHAIDEHEGLCFFSMEAVVGETLAQRLSRPLPADDALRITRQIAFALEAAHRVGITHRDLKPANVMVDGDGIVKVLDFGIASSSAALTAGFAAPARARESAPREPVGRIVGTPGYMSPEQIRGQNVDGRSDLHALGAILFECLSGHRALEAPTVEARLEKTLHGHPDWSLLPTEISNELRAIIVSCLEKDPGKRPSSAHSVRRAIDEELARRIVRRHLECHGAFDASPASRERVRLPHPLTRLIGRSDEVATVAQALDTSRLVTLTGPGGCGKSRLALEVARELTQIEGRFADGVNWIDLTPLQSSHELLETVIRTLEIVEKCGTNAEDTLLEYLRDKSVLLVLDNCEHLLPDCGRTLAKWLRECANLSVLATSREVLHTSGETAIRVEPLAVPVDSDIAGAPDAFSDGAVGLFLERARAANSQFTPTTEALDDIVAICRRLEGMPLAIELAAARIRSMTAHQVLQRLDDRFAFLRSRDPSVASRHRDLHALVGWSYDLLDDQEQQFLCRLSVFRGGCSLEAAERVCMERIDGDALDLLTSLIDKSLVVPDHGASGGTSQVRYRMLQTIREFGESQIADSTEQEPLRRRHAEFFRDEVCRVQDDTGPLEWLRQLDLEYDDAMAAIQWFVTASGEAGHAVLLASRLCKYWELRGLWIQARQVSDEVLARTTHALADSTRVHLMVGRAFFAWRLGDYEAAEAGFRESLQLAEDLADESSAAAAQLKFGMLEQSRGRLEVAKDLLRQAYETHVRLDNTLGRSIAAMFLGRLLRLQGDLEGASTFCQESLDLSREIDYQRGIANASSSLGTILHMRGRWDEARAAFEESLRIHRELEDRPGIALARFALAITASFDGRFDEARSEYEACLKLWREMGDQENEAGALNNLGSLLMDRGDFPAAREVLERGLAIRRALGNEGGLPFLLSNLGWVALMSGDTTAARDWFVEAIGKRRRHGDSRAMVSDLRGLASALVELHREELAVRVHGCAEALEEDLEARGVESTTREEWRKQEEELVRRDSERMIESLGEERFTLLWREGRSLSGASVPELVAENDA